MTNSYYGSGIPRQKLKTYLNRKVTVDLGKIKGEGTIVELTDTEGFIVKMENGKRYYVDRSAFILHRRKER